MQRSELPFESRGVLAKVLLLFLGEVSLGFLAITATALTLVPMLFEMKPQTSASAWVEAGQWAIIGVFALEYALALLFAPGKKAFVLSAWRILDLVTIAIPLVTLFPQVSHLLRSSPVLRLIRVLRVVSFGVRASGVIARKETSRAGVGQMGPIEVSILGQAKSALPRSGSWEEFLEWVKTPEEEWYHVSNLGPDQLKEVAQAAGIAPAFLESSLYGAGYPHMDFTERYAVLFVWLPEVLEATAAGRNGLLLLATEHGVFTLSRRPTGLLTKVAAILPGLSQTALPFSVRMTGALLQAVLDRNETLVGRFERELHELEEVPLRESRPEFFERTFRLKKELAAAQCDLWRLKGILASLGEGRLRIPGGGGAGGELFKTLAEEADYLYETVVNTREELLSLIDLHLNVVSFEMNRVMRVLAVVSVLGLIPAVVGGLFGMNLADNPWPFTLPQVAFGVCFGMVLCFYLFVVKGWLR